MIDYDINSILCKAAKNHFIGYGNQTMNAKVFNENVKISLLR